MALNIIMHKDYLIVHIMAFGNFLAYLIDCYKNERILESPFSIVGNAHSRDHQNENSTKTADMNQVLMNNPYHKKLYEKYCNNEGAKVIGIYWPQKYFPYILHVSVERTNSGQYGKSGIAFAQENFYEFTKKHKTQPTIEDYFVRLKDFFNFECTEKNSKVPRIVLRNLFWLTFVKEKKHIWTTSNNFLRNSKHEKISIETILDYKMLKTYLYNIFNFNLEFRDIHKKFIDINSSLAEFKNVNNIIDAVKNTNNIPIPSLSVIGECIVLFQLEKHFFDINFFNIPFYFKNTSEILDYVKYYPSYMKQPNKFFTTNWQDFKHE